MHTPKGEGLHHRGRYFPEEMVHSNEGVHKEDGADDGNEGTGDKKPVAAKSGHDFHTRDSDREDGVAKKPQSEKNGEG